MPASKHRRKGVVRRRRRAMAVRRWMVRSFEGTEGQAMRLMASCMRAGVGGGVAYDGRVHVKVRRRDLRGLGRLAKMHGLEPASGSRGEGTCMDGATWPG